MKKFFTVLLVAVLAVGIGFAGFKGEASLGFGLDLDKGPWGFTNGTDLEGDFTFEFGKGDGSSVGEGDVYAEIKASYSVTEKFVLPGTSGTQTIKAVVDDAKIHFVIDEENEVVVGILGAGGCNDYAHSYWLLKNGKPAVNAVTFPEVAAHGFTVAFKDWNAGFGMDGNIGTKAYQMAGHLETQEFPFAENGFVQAAVYGALGNIGVGKDFGFAVRGGYKEEGGLNLDAAVDFHAASTTAIAVETGVNFAIAPVAVNLYYTNVGADNLNAKLSLALGDFTIWAETKQVITATRTLALGFTGKAGEVSFGGSFGVVDFAKKEFEIKANAGGFADLTIELGLDLKAATDLSLKVTYEPEILTAVLDLGFNFATVAGKTVTTFKPGLTVETDKLINNATVSFGYTSGAFGGAAPTKGAFDLGCKVAFK